MASQQLDRMYRFFSDREIHGFIDSKNSSFRPKRTSATKIVRIVHKNSVLVRVYQLVADSIGIENHLV